MLSFAAPSWQTAILAQNTHRGPLGSGKARMASLIVPRVYLSDYFTATNEQELSRLSITHVISVLDRPAAIPDCIPEANRLRISVADRVDVDLSSYFDQTTEFITAALAENEENNVLVHCFQGVSRSATVIAAYIVATTTMTASESIAYIQAKRSVVSPNSGFRSQLETWGAQFVPEDKHSGGRMTRLSQRIADRMRELKAVAGAPPTPAKRTRAS